MMNNTGGRLRLSANELQAALVEEKKKWRIFRLQQVRDQARHEASRIRRNVEEKKKQMVNDVGRDVLQKWQEEKENCVQQLQYEYDECYAAFGKAHEQAKQEPDAAEMLEENMAVNRMKAARRGREAAEVQKIFVVEKNKDRNKMHQKKEFALRKEKLRAQRIAQLPTPKAFRKEEVVAPEPVPKVQLYEHGTLTTTNYVPKGVIIEKEIMSTKPSAHLMAEREEAVRHTVAEEERKEAELEEIKRDERGKAALRKEQLQREYQNMLDLLEKAQQERRLSEFIAGTSFNIYEREESKLKKKELHQENMEAAVEKVLQKEAQEPLPIDQLTSITDEASDLKEFSADTTPESPAETSMRKDLEEFREKVRKHRLLIAEAIAEHKESDGEGEQEGRDKLETEHLDHGRDTSPMLQPDLQRADEPLLERIYEEDEIPLPPRPYEKTKYERYDIPLPLHHDYEKKRYERDKIPSYAYEEPHQCHVIERDSDSEYTTQIMPQPDHQARGDDDNIHFTETVPVHLLPKNRYYSKRSDYEHIQTSSPGSSGETDHPLSSDDIEVKIYLSDDSTIQNSPHELGDLRHKIADDAKALYDPGNYSSTDYLSLPSSFHAGIESDDQLKNIEKIQQRRQDIQKLLDNGRPTQYFHPEPSTTATYFQELSPADGKGRKPLSKRSKFQLKKQMLVQHYLKKLLDAREEDVMQLSASTVGSSGITISSDGTLLGSLKSDDGDSKISSLPDVSVSSPCLDTVSSATYSDIDEVPTKLTSSEITESPDMPQFDVCTGIGTNFGSFLDSRNTREDANIYPVPKASQVLCDTRTSSLPRSQGFHSALNRQFVSSEYSTVTDSSISVGEFQEENLQMEAKVLKDLLTIQKLKQALLNQRDSVMKEIQVPERQARSQVPERQARSQVPERQARSQVPERQARSQVPERQARSQVPERQARSDDGTTFHSHGVIDPNAKLEKTAAELDRLIHRTLQSAGRANQDIRYSKHPTQPTFNAPISEEESFESEGSFQKLIPEQTLASISAYREAVPPNDQSLKSLANSSLSETNFMPLVPQSDLHPRKTSSSSADTPPPSLEVLSNTLGRTQGSLIPSNFKGGLRKYPYLEDLVEESTLSASSSIGEDISLPKMPHEGADKSPEINQYEVAKGPLMRNHSCESAKLQESSSKSSESAKLQESSSKSSQSAKQQESSSESVASLPDMAEVLQRFGFDLTKGAMPSEKDGRQLSSSEN